MKKSIKIALIFAASLSVVYPVFSQSSSPASNTAGPVSGRSEKDGKFVSDLMVMNGYELMLIKLTLQKATDVSLRDAANQMLPDHQRLDAQLTAYANRINLGMDPGKREKYAAKIGKWEAKPAGNDWDADLIEEFVDIHKDGVDMLHDAIKDVTDGELKALFAQTEIKMRDHLNMLTPLKGKIKHADANTAMESQKDVQDANMDHNAAIVDKMRDGNSKDAKFFSDAMGANLYMLNILEIVLKKAQSPDLKDAARRMMEEHQMLAERLKRYGTAKSYGIEPDKGSKYNDKVAKWDEKKGGMEWDADIIEELRDLHKDNVDMLADASKDVRDEELKALLTQATGTEQRHLELVAPLKEKVKKPWKNK